MLVRDLVRLRVRGRIEDKSVRRDPESCSIQVFDSLVNLCMCRKIVVLVVCSCTGKKIIQQNNIKCFHYKTSSDLNLFFLF